jgi:hypothetical protein
VLTDEKFDSEYLAMSELTKEIGLIVQDSLDEGQSDLSSSDIEHILKITSDVTLKIKSKLPIDYLSIMTGTVTKKLKNQLLVN